MLSKRLELDALNEPQPFERSVNPGATPDLELDLAGRERLVLHHNRAAAGQNHDVQLLLLLVGLLVPIPHHFSVMGRDQCHLRTEWQV